MGWCRFAVNTMCNVILSYIKLDLWMEPDKNVPAFQVVMKCSQPHKAVRNVNLFCILFRRPEGGVNFSVRDSVLLR